MRYRSPWKNVFQQTLLLLAVVYAASPAAGQNVLFSEDFEGLTLGEQIDEAALIDNIEEEAYSPDGPEGWTVDRSQVPAGGVLEFSGWNFLNPTWWVNTAGNQDRDGFTFAGEGVTAVADGDEWDDAVHEPGNMTTFLRTPAIPVSSGDIELNFDTSWRPDGTQEAQVNAIFDVGDPLELMHWYSSEDAGGPLSEDGLFGFRSDPVAEGAPADEIVSIPFSVPSGASNVTLEFGYLNAGNNWWWAVDNIALGDDYFEDFEGVELGPNLQEGRLPENLRGELSQVWTDVPPAGWAIDDSGVPGVEDENNDGVTEWAGWSFADKNWWTAVAGDQRRSEYDAGEGIVLIADPDEWDDQSHAPSEENGWYQTTIDTPQIPLEGLNEGDELMLEFDSSWRPEFDSNFRQSARITARFSDGSESEIMEWNSAEGGVTEEFLAGSEVPDTVYGELDKLNDEDLTFPIPYPEGATWVSVQFEMFDAGNDWWWAIDNVRLLGPGDAAMNPEECVGDIDGDCEVAFADFLILSANFGQAGAAAEGDLDGDGMVGFPDFLILSSNFGQAGSTGAAVPEPTGLAMGWLAFIGLLSVRRRQSR